MTELKVTFTCAKCGGHRLAIEDEENDASRVTCEACGHDFCTYGELKAAASEKAKDAVENLLGDVFRNAGFKVTKT